MKTKKAAAMKIVNLCTSGIDIPSVESLSGKRREDEYQVRQPDPRRLVTEKCPVRSAVAEVWNDEHVGNSVETEG